MDKKLPNYRLLIVQGRNGNYAILTSWNPSRNIFEQVTGTRGSVWFVATAATWEKARDLSRIAATRIQDRRYRQAVCAYLRARTEPTNELEILVVDSEATANEATVAA